MDTDHIAMAILQYLWGWKKQDRNLQSRLPKKKEDCKRATERGPKSKKGHCLSQLWILEHCTLGCPRRHLFSHSFGSQSLRSGVSRAVSVENCFLACKKEETYCISSISLSVFSSGQWSHPGAPSFVPSFNHSNLPKASLPNTIPLRNSTLEYEF